MTKEWEIEREKTIGTLFQIIYGFMDEGEFEDATKEGVPFKTILSGDTIFKLVLMGIAKVVDAV